MMSPPGLCFQAYERVMFRTVCGVNCVRNTICENRPPDEPIRSRASDAARRAIGGGRWPGPVHLGRQLPPVPHALDADGQRYVLPRSRRVLRAGESRLPSGRLAGASRPDRPTVGQLGDGCRARPPAGPNRPPVAAAGSDSSSVGTTVRLRRRSQTACCPLFSPPTFMAIAHSAIPRANGSSLSSNWPASSARSSVNWFCSANRSSDSAARAGCSSAISANDFSGSAKSYFFRR
jgi:hypothetical protein